MYNSSLQRDKNQKLSLLLQLVLVILYVVMDRCMVVEFEFYPSMRSMSVSMYTVDNFYKKPFLIEVRLMHGLSRGKS